MKEEKVLFDPMFELAYRDCMYDIKHLQIYGNEAFYEEKFSNVKFKINVEKFKELLKHHFESFKALEKFANEKKFGNECFLQVLYNGEHIYAPLYYFDREVGEETKKYVDNSIKVILKDFLNLCRTCQITPDNVAYEIETEIKALKPNTEFSMREIFSKYADLFWGLDDAVEVYKIVLKNIKSKISQLDKFEDKFERIEPDDDDFDFFQH